MPRLPKILLPLLTAGLLMPLAASAACSRVINVPLSPTGFSVIDSGELIAGIYPEILNTVGAKEKCEFRMFLVPRARLELMFENGQADILIPATRTPKRDPYGIFIPLVRNRATLISIDSTRAPVQNLQELINQGNSRLIVVRGFDYGDRYQALLQTMQKQNRLIMEADPVSAARMLKSGGGDYALMAPTIFAGSVEVDARVDDLSGRLRFEALPELPWGDSGLYLSKKSLNAEDLAALQDLFDRMARSGVVWKGFQRYYRREMLKDGVRPLDAPPSR